MATNVKPKRIGGAYPVPVSDPEQRKKTFAEVEQPYTEEEVRIEADRCLRCGNPVCIDACPVQMDVRGMCDAVANGDFATAFHRVQGDERAPGCDSEMLPPAPGTLRGRVRHAVAGRAHLDRDDPEVRLRLGAEGVEAARPGRGGGYGQACLRRRWGPQGSLPPPSSGGMAMPSRYTKSSRARAGRRCMGYLIIICRKMCWPTRWRGSKGREWTSGPTLRWGRTSRSPTCCPSRTPS